MVVLLLMLMLLLLMMMVLLCVCCVCVCVCVCRVCVCMCVCRPGDFVILDMRENVSHVHKSWHNVAQRETDKTQEHTEGDEGEMRATRERARENKQKRRTHDKGGQC